MKKLLLLLFAFVFSLSLYSQYEKNQLIVIPGTAVQPVLLDSINPETGLKEVFVQMGFVVEFKDIYWNNDSSAIGVYYADSISLIQADFVSKDGYNKTGTKIIESETQISLYATDKDVMLYWINNVYIPHMKPSVLPFYRAKVYEGIE